MSLLVVLRACLDAAARCAPFRLSAFALRSTVNLFSWFTRGDVLMKLQQAGQGVRLTNRSDFEDYVDANVRKPDAVALLFVESRAPVVATFARQTDATERHHSHDALQMTRAHPGSHVDRGAHRFVRDTPLLSVAYNGTKRCAARCAR